MPSRIPSPPTTNGHQNGDNEIDAQDDDMEQEHNDSDYSSDASDANSDLDQLGSQEFPSHFLEIGGRLYHSSPTSPYPLPVDAPEQERLTMVHELLRQFIGANYVGPVAETLAQAQSPQRRKLVLDLCTGTGKWVIEMAEEFPHVHFRAFDIVPIATRYPPRNVRFEIEDVDTASGFRWPRGTFDMVNARFVVMATRDYSRMLGEVARVLCPGGLLVSYEWGPFTYFHPSLTDRDPSIHAPASCRLLDAVNAALDTRGVQPIAPRLSRYIEGSRDGHGNFFTEISSMEQYVPIGAWSRDPGMRGIGRACLEAHVRYADSVKPLLIGAGWSEDEVREMERDYIQEITTVQGLVAVLYTVHARRA